MGRKTNTYGSLIALKQLLNLLHRYQMTQPEIQEATGLTNSTVSRWLKLLHAGYPQNLVAISGWRRVGTRGNYSAVWGAGFGMLDTPKPKPLTSAQYAKRWREKKAREGRISKPEEGRLIHRSDTSDNLELFGESK
jgi:hypothetical protein